MGPLWRRQRWRRRRRRQRRCGTKLILEVMNKKAIVCGVSNPRMVISDIDLEPGAWILCKLSKFDAAPSGTHWQGLGHVANGCRGHTLGNSRNARHL